MNKEILEKGIEEILKTKPVVSGRELAEITGYTETNVNIYLNKYGMRERDIFVQLPVGFIKSFDEVSPEMSYWIGYLQADGCVSDSKGKIRVILECQYRDKSILEQFCLFCKINPYRIKETRHSTPTGEMKDYVRIDLAKSSFSTFCDKWIIPNKSYSDIIDLPNDLLFYNYLLGLLDGDGCISLGEGRNRIIFLLRDPMLTSIRKKLAEELPYPTSIWITNHKKTSGLYEMTIGPGQPPNNIEKNNFLFLYKKWYLETPTSHLSRKRVLLEKYLSQYFDICPL